MSYQMEARGAKDEIDQALLRGMDQVADATAPEFRDATTEHTEAARQAVTRLLPFVGRDSDPIRVVVSGHANPDHEPMDRYADETITVTVQVAR